MNTNLFADEESEAEKESRERLERELRAQRNKQMPAFLKRIAHACACVMEREVVDGETGEVTLRTRPWDTRLRVHIGHREMCKAPLYTHEEGFMCTCAPAVLVEVIE